MRGSLSRSSWSHFKSAFWVSIPFFLYYFFLFRPQTQSTIDESFVVLNCLPAIHIGSFFPLNWINLNMYVWMPCSKAYYSTLTVNSSLPSHYPSSAVYLMRSSYLLLYSLFFLFTECPFYLCKFLSENWWAISKTCKHVKILNYLHFKWGFKKNYKI